MGKECELLVVVGDQKTYEHGARATSRSPSQTSASPISRREPLSSPPQGLGSQQTRGSSYASITSSFQNLVVRGGLRMR